MTQEMKLLQKTISQQQAEATTLKITPVAGPDGLIADGSDIAYFDVAVVDKDGNT